jgi:DNA polymerase III epsilon subunit-like protein
MKYAVIDTEGSGLFDYTKPADAPGQPRMAALGIIRLDDYLKVESRHSWLIKPEGWTFDNNSDAAKKNGLTHEELMEKGSSAMEGLQIYNDALSEGRIIVGFNVLHDLKTLRAEMRYLGLPDRYMETRYICVMQGCRAYVDARTADGKKKAPKLEEACTFYGIEVEGGDHTALPDAERAYQILVILRDAGCMPPFKDPYEKTSKPAQNNRKKLDQGARPAGWHRGAGADYEQEVVSSQDFIGGASEDGK